MGLHVPRGLGEWTFAERPLENGPAAALGRPVLRPEGQAWPPERSWSGFGKAEPLSLAGCVYPDYNRGRAPSFPWLCRLALWASRPGQEVWEQSPTSASFTDRLWGGGLLPSPPQDPSTEGRAGR